MLKLRGLFEATSKSSDFWRVALAYWSQVAPSDFSIASPAPVVVDGSLMAHVYGTSLQASGTDRIAAFLTFDSVSTPRIADGTYLPPPSDLAPGEQFVITPLDALSESQLIADTGATSQVPLQYRRVQSDGTLSAPAAYTVDWQGASALPVTALITPVSLLVAKRIERFLESPRLVGPTDLLIRTEEVA